MAIPSIPSPAELPLVLSGPILRRVTKRSVAVWVATRAAQTVTLSILKTSAGPPLATATAATIQIGAFVHVALVEADISSASLDNATVYYYDLTFSGGAGLRAAGIMSPPGVTPPTTILGYASSKPAGARRGCIFCLLRSAPRRRSFQRG
jgi:hypothetical protein